MIGSYCWHLVACLFPRPVTTGAMAETLWQPFRSGGLMMNAVPGPLVSSFFCRLKQEIQGCRNPPSPAALWPPAYALPYLQRNRFASGSTDQGETWSGLRPTGIVSPLSPASVEPIVHMETYYWCGTTIVTSLRIDGVTAPPSPFTVAISLDGGAFWYMVKNLENNPDGWYYYAPIHEVDDGTLLVCCAGNRKNSRDSHR